MFLNVSPILHNSYLLIKLFCKAPASLPHSNGSNEAIEHLKALALQAHRDGDKEKAKEYIIQMKVRLCYMLIFSISIPA